MEGLQLALIITLIIILILVFNQQLSYWISATKDTIVSMLTGEPPGKSSDRLLDDDDDSYERLSDPKITTTNSPQQASQVLGKLGFPADTPWDEVMQATELDPSTFTSHMDFVKDVRRFSSGANFTSVTDDNTNSDFTNFRGLRRPEHVPIGPDARQQPDIDETVLQRNRPIRW
jgi:hypothetical protein